MMAENRTELSFTTNSELQQIDLAKAKRKRMMLAEVYVHKCRRLSTASNEDDKFEVFHIYEFDENDSNTKISPKLSTNCTEPQKIIEILKNSTGSDTPQLQRLIEKLHSQNKKVMENQNKNTVISNDTTSNTDTNGNKTMPTISKVANTSMAVTIIQPTLSANTVPAKVSEPSKQYAPSTNLPAIRVKTIESLKENRPNVANPPKVVTAAKTIVAQKLTNPPMGVKKILLPIKKFVDKPTEKTDTEVNRVPGATTNDSNQPVKLWNNVMQQNSCGKQLEYMVVADKNNEEGNGDESVFCLKLAEEVIENSKENNSSSLKIDQVYECVSDEFVEDLLIERSAKSAEAQSVRSQSLALTPTPPPSTATMPQQSPSPLLDSLLSEVQTPTNKNPTKLTFARPSDADCSDYRCNICLQFNGTFVEYKSHMINKHQYRLVCEKCREAFRSQIMYEGHLDSNDKCVQRENASRNFICIVDPPVILMKNNKVYAFRCKHCLLAFHNQRNYVQHAQRHAKMFRCKVCPSAKTMSSSSMQQHLLQH